MKKLFLSLLAASAVLFALPACDGLVDALGAGEEEEGENVDENGNGTADQNLPTYYNFKTEDSGNTIAFSFSVRAAGQPYYDVKYEWTFKDDACTKCIETFDCKSEAIAILVAAEYKDDPTVSISGKNILLDLTEDFEGQSKDEVCAGIKQIQASMEYLNELAANPGESSEE